MRDYRTSSHMLQARYNAARRRVRSVPRVVLNPVRMQAVAQRNVRQDVHVTWALSVSTPRVQVVQRHELHVLGDVESAMHAPRVPSSAIPVVAPVASNHLHTHVMTDVITNRVDREVVNTRAESRVTHVERVVQRTSSMPAQPAPEGAAWPASSPRRYTPSVAAPAAAIAAPSAAELATITNHVLTAIDRRLIAHNERLGRA